MDNGRFNIFEAVKNAYQFAGREWRYLLKAGALPLFVQVGTSLFVQFAREDATAIEAYLWGLPASALFAWFMFLEVRLLLLGERLDRLPQDSDYQRNRHHVMKISVIIYLLFNMSSTLLVTILWAITETATQSEHLLFQIGGMIIIGALFWGVRFGVAPILAAVSYPIRPALERVQGMMFSLRLTGMGLLCLLPLVFLLQFVIGAFVNIEATEDMAEALKMTPDQQIALTIVTAPFFLAGAALLNAAAAYALKQILGKNNARDGVLV